LAAPRVHAANDDGVPIGTQAAMTGAAVTATTSGAAAGFYNPAGLAQSKESSIDASLSAYGLRLQHFNPVLVGPDGSTTDAHVTDWVLVPSMVAYVRKINEKWFGSFGVYVPRTQNYVSRARLDARDGTTWLGVQQAQSNAYYMGFSMGAQVHRDLRLGFSLFGLYSASYSYESLAGGRLDMPNGTKSTASNLNAARDYGLTARFGLQWDINAHWSIGASVYAPSITLLRTLDQTAVTTSSSSTGNDMLTLQDHGGRHFAGSLGGAPGFRMGAAYYYERGWVSLDATVNPPLDFTGANLDRRFSWNLRAGAIYRFSNSYTGGAGFFTDRNAAKGPGADYYGLTVGALNTREYKFEDKRTLKFTTGVSLRYAFGYGHQDVLAVDSSQGASTIITTAHGRVTANEISVNVGSGISF
jgi:hypothetical protein